MTTEPTKRCAHCGEEKPLSAFYLRTNYSYSDNGAIDHRPGQPCTGACKLCDHKTRAANKTKRRQLSANRPPTTPLPLLGSTRARGTASHRYYRATQELRDAQTRSDP